MVRDTFWVVAAHDTPAIDLPRPPATMHHLDGMRATLGGKRFKVCVHVAGYHDLIEKPSRGGCDG